MSNQHWRYLIARYGALPVVWCAAGEGTMPWWLTLRGSDEQPYRDLVHRALACFPTGPKTVRTLEGANGLLACATAEMASHVRSSWPADQLDQALALAESHGIRVIANAITLHAWRNGPVEDVHAGGEKATNWARGGYFRRPRRRSSARPRAACIQV